MSKTLVRLSGWKPDGSSLLSFEFHRPFVLPVIRHSSNGEVTVPTSLLETTGPEAYADLRSRGHVAIPSEARVWLAHSLNLSAHRDHQGEPAPQAVVNALASVDVAYAQSDEPAGRGTHDARSRQAAEILRAAQVKAANAVSVSGGEGPPLLGCWIEVWQHRSARELLAVFRVECAPGEELEIPLAPYWSYRPGGVRRAAPPRVDHVVYRSADTGILDGDPRRPRQAGWRDAFVHVTARRPFDRTRVAPPNAGCPGQPLLISCPCGVANDVRTLLLDVLTNPGTMCSTWLPAVAGWAKSLCPPRTQELFGAYADEVLNGVGKPIPGVLPAWREARTSWLERGLLTPGDPAFDRGSQALVRRLVNGMSPHDFGRHPNPRDDAEHHWIWTRTFEAEEPGANGYVQPDVRAWLLPARPSCPGSAWETDALPSLKVIEVRFPGGEWQRFECPADFPASEPPSVGQDGLRDYDAQEPAHAQVDDWSHAQRLVRQALLVSGEVDWHVARCHFYAELLLVALRRSLPQDDPLHALLWPFLRSADEINAFGEELLFDDQGLLAQATGVPYQLTQQRIATMLCSWDWRTFVPRRPLCPEDNFAFWGNVCWEAAGDWAASALTDEVLSEERMRRFAGCLCDGLPNVVDAPPESRGRGGELPDGWTWPDPSPLPNTLAIPAGPAEWRRFFQHALWSVTFLHSWVGHAQRQDGSNPLLAPLGLRWRGMPGPGESLETHGPVPAHAWFQCALAEILVEPRWGMLLDARSEAGGEAVAYPRLQAMIEARLASMQAELGDAAAGAFQGFELARIRGRVDI